MEGRSSEGQGSSLCGLPFLVFRVGKARPKRDEDRRQHGAEGNGARKSPVVFLRRQVLSAPCLPGIAWYLRIGLSVTAAEGGLYMTRKTVGVKRNPVKAKRLVERLRRAMEKERELDAILKHSHDGLWIMDGDGVTLHVSDSWEKFAGIKRDVMIGRSVYDIVKEGYFSDSAAIHVIQEKRLVSVVYETRTGRRALVTGSPVFSEDGSIWRIVSNVRDFAKLTNLQQEIEQDLTGSDSHHEKNNLLTNRRFKTREIIARSPGMEKVLDLAGLAALSAATVLVSGESGVGKEIVARQIHNLSRSRENPFIKVNCGAIPETLLESELFGYEEGSFTGARKRGKPGMFELAQGGTIFLDEIGEMPLALQAKLLQVLQDREVMRVGGIKTVTLDVRIITATNRNLEEMVSGGAFRKDLFYRINVIPITVPPLRERREDIVPLTLHFLERFNKRYENLSKTFSPDALESLPEYAWPGNVRELENLVERLVVTTSGKEITPEKLPGYFGFKHEAALTGGADVIPLRRARDDLEKRLVEKALVKYGSTYKAARALGIAQSTVVKKARKYGIEGS